ncbi:hypothetical protein LTR37_020186 [Vermiconidia calcicola]|uniref:Uncharacterized protein n=1 Tax=Vermiconidia calcicola TaxID=1690605 RepID=A0ACC3MC26_9PEZI|nr:hypothetical protein LTR37_020186 [Vermiconidia calcicola]
MATSAEILLYDLPSRHRGEDHLSSFSFNPWRTRLVLNYKQIPYKTEWTEYPDLAPKLKSLGVQANEPGTAFADYSSPTVRLMDGTMVMNSINIVSALEQRYPEPTLHLDAELHGPITEAVEGLLFVIWWDALASIPRGVLTEKSASYFAEGRAAYFGTSLDDLAATKGGEKAWEAAAVPGGPADKLKDVLTKHRRDQGPFALGSQVSYGDFVAVGLFECVERSHLESYERLMGLHDTFKTLHEACRPWLARDD